MWSIVIPNPQPHTNPLTYPPYTWSAKEDVEHRNAKAPPKAPPKKPLKDAQPEDSEERLLEELVVERDGESFKVQMKKQGGRNSLACLLVRKTNPDGGKNPWKQLCQLVVKELSAGLTMLLMKQLQAQLVANVVKIEDVKTARDQMLQAALNGTWVANMMSAEPRPEFFTSKWYVQYVEAELKKTKPQNPLPAIARARPLQPNSSDEAPKEPKAPQPAAPAPPRPPVENPDTAETQCFSFF